MFSTADPPEEGLRGAPWTTSLMPFMRPSWPFLPCQRVQSSIEQSRNNLMWYPFGSPSRIAAPASQKSNGS